MGYVSRPIYIFSMVVPKGSNNKRANLNICKPQGIKRIVTHKTAPKMYIDNADSQPKKMAHKMFKNILKPVTDVNCGSYPNGHKAKRANLKNCRPIGINRRVMQSKRPAMK